MEIKITLTEEQVAQVLKESRKITEIETYSIIGAAKKIGISKTKIYQLLKDGEITKIMIGKSPRIHRLEIEKFTTKTK